MVKRLLSLCTAFLLCTLVLAPDVIADESYEVSAKLQSASDRGNNYPYPDKTYGRYLQPDDVDPWNFFYRECTSFVAWCLNSRNGIGFHNRLGGIRWGNAGSWDDAARTLGYPVDTTPAVGAVAYCNPWSHGTGENGHVAWVSEVNGDDVLIEEYNYNPKAPGTFGTRTVNKYSFDGFIHIKDIASATSVVADGIYYLRSALDNNLVVGVESESKEWGGNICIESYEATSSQRFIVSAHDGYYTIVNMNSQLSVDVSGASSEIGINVQQYNNWASETKAQQWYFEDSGDGYYFIRSALGTYLDVQGGVATKGQNIQTYARNGSAAQKFKLDMVSPSISSVSVQEGTYYLHSALDDNLVLGVQNASNESGANVELETYNRSASQQFIIEDFFGNYTIVNNNSHLSLDVSGASSESGINVQQYHYWPSETKAQQWCFEDAGGGYYYIRSALGTYLDVQGGVTAVGQNIQTYVGNGLAAQKFRLELCQDQYSNISFSSNGGSGSMNDLKILDGTVFTLPPCTFTAPNGKQFKAWSINGVEYAPGDVYSVSGDITILSIWNYNENPQIIEVVKSFEENTVTVLLHCEDEHLSVFCGIYRNDGRMISTSIAKTTNKEEYVFQFSEAQFDYAKVFLLDDYLKPMCTSRRT